MSPPVVLVHGFTQTARSWDAMAAHLPGGLDVCRVELPGHGAAGEDRPSFVEAAAAVGEAGGHAVYAGYSMGGRLCLRLALDRPDRVAGLVLMGASPGLEGEAEREQRRRSDEQLAASIEGTGVAGFLDAWLAQPLLAGTATQPGDREARRANSAAGLAHALRALGTGTQQPLWHRLCELAVPTLLVVGERDTKFAGVADRMAAAIGRPGLVRTAVVPGAGHAVPLDAPAACAALVAGFVAGLH